MKFRIAALDGLRGSAAVLILLYHRRWWLPFHLFQSGYLAVDFFFCLSGFVIAHAYHERLRSMTLWSFFRARMIRLYPMIAVGAALGAAVFIAQAYRHGTEDAASFGTVALAFLTLPTPWHGADLFPIDGPLWSIFFEIVVNLLYAALLPLLTTRALIGLAAALFIWLIAATDPATGVRLLGYMAPDFIGGLPRAGFSFLVGVILQRWAKSGHLPQIKIPFELLAIAMVLVLASGAGPIGPRCKDLICVAIVFPAIIAVGCQIETVGFRSRIARALGELSYPLYTVHYPLYAVIGFFLERSIPGIQLLVGSVILILTISAALARFYDQPARRWLAARWTENPASAENQSTPRADAGAP